MLNNYSHFLSFLKGLLSCLTDVRWKKKTYQLSVQLEINSSEEILNSKAGKNLFRTRSAGK